jgi:hypothetical protein
MLTFLEYSIHRVREQQPKKLGLLLKSIKSAGLVAIDHTDDEKDPHIFVRAHPQPEEFQGIRLYILGHIVAFRSQKLEDTAPYGKAYLLDMQKIYEDLLEEEDPKNEEEKKETLKKLVRIIGDKIRKYWSDTIEDEEEQLQDELGGMERTDIGGAMLAPAYGNDYSSAVYNSTKN